MTDKSACKYFDAGWCYAPNYLKTNAINSACVNPYECPISPLSEPVQYETPMTEMKTCHNCKHYKDYDGIFDWISSRIFGFPTLQKCFHPNRVKIDDYVNGTTCPYTTCSTERSYGNCGIMRNNWEAK